MDDNQTPVDNGEETTPTPETEGTEGGGEGSM